MVLWSWFGNNLGQVSIQHFFLSTSVFFFFSVVPDEQKAYARKSAAPVSFFQSAPPFICVATPSASS